MAQAPPLTLIFPGKTRHLSEDGGRIGSRQPSWSLGRPSSHEAGVLRHRRSGDQHIDLVQLQRPVRPAPDCDGHARSSRRPRDARGIAQTCAIARRGSRPQHHGPTVHRRHRQEWPVRTVIAGRHLPADWAQSPSLRRDVQGLTVSPRDHAQAAAQHLGSLLDLVKQDAAVNRRLTADRRSATERPCHFRARTGSESGALTATRGPSGLAPTWAAAGQEQAGMIS